MTSPFSPQPCSAFCFTPSLQLPNREADAALKLPFVCSGSDLDPLQQEAILIVPFLEGNLPWLNKLSLALHDTALGPSNRTVNNQSDSMTSWFHFARPLPIKKELVELTGYYAINTSTAPILVQAISPVWMISRTANRTVCLPLPPCV